MSSMPTSASANTPEQQVCDPQRPDFGSPVFARWRAACEPIWNDYVQHAFVAQLGSGRLPRQAYIDYLIQDYLFLKHFARAWALVVVKSDSVAEMRVAATTVDALVNHEMQLHVRTCATHGISEAALGSAVEKNANLAYTRYVLDAGFSGDLPELLAALAPCVFGYGEIGWRLAQSSSAANPYRPWIDTYASESYQDVCRSVGRLLEGALAERLGTEPGASVRWPRLQERFTRATALEVAFWQMALNADPS